MDNAVRHEHEEFAICARDLRLGSENV